MKTCKKCLLEKPFEQFYKCSLMKDGYENSCKKCRDVLNKKWFENNKERKHQTCQLWTENNHEALRQKRVIYYENIRENNLKNEVGLFDKTCPKCKVKKTSLEFDKNRSNRDGLCSWCHLCRLQQTYNREKKDPAFKLRRRISRAINTGLKNNGLNKISSIWSKLPYTPQQLKEHLEKLWDPWMNWDNHGNASNKRKTWQIDHIIPRSFFVFTSVDDISFQKCWSLENLRPFESFANLRKGNKIII